MKAFSIALIPILFFAAMFQPKATETKGGFYYYCTSRAKMPELVKGKETVLFSDIKLVADKAELAEKTAAWTEKVSGMCTNDVGCSAEVRSYANMELARAALDAEKANYTDAAKFVVQNVMTR